MTGWKRRRVWTQAAAVAVADGHGVTLDGRPLHTPAKAPLHVPTAALARAIAAEWQTQGDVVDPLTMPFTRSASAAIDRVGPQRAEVAAMVAAYGDSDLLCYRAQAPLALVERQAAAWDPLLDWAAVDLGARLQPVQGVMHRAQPPRALAALTARVQAMDHWQLTALHDLVVLSGSLVIGLAVIHDDTATERLWDLSRIDETWQEEQWGPDDEARDAAARKRSEFLHARRFNALTRPVSGND